MVGEGTTSIGTKTCASTIPRGFIKRMPSSFGSPRWRESIGLVSAGWARWLRAFVSLAQLGTAQDACHFDPQERPLAPPPPPKREEPAEAPSWPQPNDHAL